MAGKEENTMNKKSGLYTDKFRYLVNGFQISKTVKSKVTKLGLSLVALSLLVLLASCGQQKIKEEIVTGAVIDKAPVALILPEVQGLTIDMSSTYTDLGGALKYSVASNTDATVATASLDLVNKTFDLEFLKVGSTTVTLEERNADNSLRGTTKLQIDITPPLAPSSGEELAPQAIASKNLADVNIKILQNFNGDASIRFGNLTNSNTDVLNATIVNENQLNLKFQGVSGSTIVTFKDLNALSDVHSPTVSLNLVVVAPPKVADLEVTKSDPVDPIIITYGKVLTNFPYNIVVKNIGTASAENVKLTDVFETPGPVAVVLPLPDGCTVTEGETVNYIQILAVEESEASHTIECDLGTLAPNEMKMLEFVYQPIGFRQSKAERLQTLDVETVESDEESELPEITFTNTVTVETTSSETNLANNEAVEETTLVQELPEFKTFTIKKIVQLAEGAQGSLPNTLPNFTFDYSCPEFGNGNVTIAGSSLTDGEEVRLVSKGILAADDVVDTCPQIAERTDDLPDGWEMTDRTITLENNDLLAVFTNTYTPPVIGSILIEKETVGAPNGDTTEFPFTTNIASLNAFTLANDSAQQIGGLNDGTYTVTETAIDDWSLTGISCDNDQSTVDLTTRTATIKVIPGETITCTFTNTYTPPLAEASCTLGTAYEETVGTSAKFRYNISLSGDVDAIGEPAGARIYINDIFWTNSNIKGVAAINPVLNLDTTVYTFPLTYRVDLIDDLSRVIGSCSKVLNTM